MKEIILLLIVISTTFNSYCAPDFVVGDLQHNMMQQQMNSMMHSFNANSSNNYLQLGFFTIYSKDSSYSGFGELSRDGGGDFSGVDRYSFIEINGIRFNPQQTDSIFFFDKKGMPDGNDWLFNMEQGRISTYNNLPLGEIVKVSIDGSPFTDYKKTNMLKMLKEIPLVWAFYEKDKYFAIRLFNGNIGLEKYKANKDVSFSKLSFAIFSEKMSKKNSEELLKAFPEHYISHYVNAKYFCEKKEFKEAEMHLARLKSLIPNIYLSYEIEGYFLFQQRKLEEALIQYHLAFTFAPNNKKIINKIKQKIDDIKWKLKL